MKPQFKRPCSWSACKQLTTKTYCDTHSSLYETGRRDRRREYEPWRYIYGTKEWKRARRYVLARDRHCCKATGCTQTERLTIHHIQPLSKGGAPFDADNLLTLCYKHHAMAERLQS